MDVNEIINRVTERVQQTANVRVVFGDPITTENMTLIPVACVKLAGGGGGGIGDKAGKADKDGNGASGSGLGLGLKVYATPVGYIEVQGGEARMVDIVDKNKLLMGGLVVGGLLALTAIKLAGWKIKHA